MGMGGINSSGFERADRRTGNFIHRQNPETGNSMGRTRTPTAVLELRGAFKNHPSRQQDREFEPVVTTDLPAPPQCLTSSATATWLEMKSRGHWLTSADKFLVEIAATLMARYRIDELKSADVSQLIGLLGKIGFSPVERGKMNLPAKGT
jgi:hypothetical protein